MLIGQEPHCAATSDTLVCSNEVEVQLGRMFTPQFGLYLEGLAGIGNDRGYNWGAGLGIRFIY